MAGLTRYDIFSKNLSSSVTLADGRSGRVREVSPSGDLGPERLGHSSLAENFAIKDEYESRLQGEQWWTTLSGIIRGCSAVTSSYEILRGKIQGSKPTILPAADAAGIPSDEAKRIAEEFELILFEDPQTDWPEIVDGIASGEFLGASLSNFWFRREPVRNGVRTLADIQIRPIRSITNWLVNRQTGRLIAVEQEGMTRRNIEIARPTLIYYRHSLPGSVDPRGYGLFRYIAKDALQLMDLEQYILIGFKNSLLMTPYAEAPIAEYQQLREKYANDPIRLQNLERNWQNTITPIRGFLRNINRLKQQPKVIFDSSIYQNTDRQLTGERTAFAAAAKKFNLSVIDANNTGFADARTQWQDKKRDAVRPFGTEAMFLGETAVGARSLADSKNNQLDGKVNSILRKIDRVVMRDLFPRIMVANNWPLELMPTLVSENVIEPEFEQIVAYLGAQTAAGISDPRDPAWNQARSEVGFDPLPQEVVDGLMVQEELTTESMQIANSNARNQGNEQTGDE